MKALPLRPYQAEAIQAVRDAFRGQMQRPAVVIPTGGGKTVIFAHLSLEWVESLHAALRLGRKVLVIAHRTELIEQAAEKLRAIAPGLRVGIVKAHRNETAGDVVVGSVQTLASENRRRMIRGVGLVIVDECHHATADTYLAILKHYGCFDADGAKAVGFTATMVRGDDRALGTVWQDVVYSRSIAYMIHGGWLVRPHGLLVEVDDLNLAGVRTSRGDYQANDLGAAISESMAPELIGKAVVEHAAGRPTILFAPTVRSAEIIGDAVSSVGRSVGLVHGAMAGDARRRILGDFKSGEIDFVTNCMVLTEGFDEPKTSCIVIARPTKNVGLYVQMVGRGLRIDQLSGKTDCLVLDVVGASARHALASPIDLFGDDKPKREMVDGELVEDEEVTASTGLGLEKEEVYATGPLRAEHVDLFHGSHAAWNQTRGGIWFLTAGERYLIIVPGHAVGTYDVVSLPVKKGAGGKAREVMTDQRDMSYAMAWAEGDVTPAEQVLARKDRDWRMKKPKDPQVALAQRLGVKIPVGATSGEVSNMISVVFASQRIDPPTAQLIRDRRQHA